METNQFHATETGEFDFIYGVGMNYQEYDEKLAKRLEEVLNSNEKDLLIRNT